jgi:TolB-like protein
MSFVAEIKRRNVLRVGLAYLVIGWLLTEVLTTILPELGAPAWTGRAVILVFALGFIPAIVLSWIYELTPDGIKRESRIDGNDDLRRSGRGFDYAAVALVVMLVLTLGYLGSQNPDLGDTDSGGISDASVAVLPFVNMSGDKDNEYFSDGLTETLLHMLAQIPDLQVAARTSSFAFKGQNQDIREIADALQVAHILEGSVQRAGDTVRITAQLIRAEDGFHVWSETYDRKMDDIFAIHDEIAVKVGGELSQSILGTNAAAASAGVGTEISDAYDLYLQALELRASNSFRALQAAENLLKGALAIDAAYLDAKTELANNYLHQFETGLLTFDGAYPQIIALTDQVLGEQPEHPAATAINLFTETVSQTLAGDGSSMPRSIERFEELVAANPKDYRIRALLGRLLRSVNRHGRALEIQLDGVTLDAFNPEIHHALGALYVDLGDFEKGREALKKSLELQQDLPNAYLKLAEISLRQGDAVEYARQMLQAIAVDPQDHEIPALLGANLYWLGLIDEGDDFRDRVFAIAPTSPLAYQLSMVRAINIGDEIMSVDAARRAIEDDIDDRQFSYGRAVQHLLRVAARNGTLAEENAFIEATAPGLLNVDAELVPAKFLGAQVAALDAWYTSLPADELQRRINVLQSATAGFGHDPFQIPAVKVSVLCMEGRIDDAVDTALDDVFSRSVLTALGWEQSIGLPHFEQFGKDSRVDDAMQRWVAEQDEEAGKLKNFLTELSAG